MLRRLPLVPTLLVLAAVLVMVRLGFWQIDRMHEKDSAIALYRAAAAEQHVVEWPAAVDAANVRQKFAYRRVRANCAEVLGIEPSAGQNARGESGWRHVAKCRMAPGATQGEVVLGWSRAPASPGWAGGEVRGIFVTSGQYQARIIADPPLAGLQPNVRPDPNEIPNNHWSYAVQWFLFALTALVIYGLALRKRLAVKGAEG